MNSRSGLGLQGVGAGASSDVKNKLFSAIAAGNDSADNGKSVEPDVEQDFSLFADDGLELHYHSDAGQSLLETQAATAVSGPLDVETNETVSSGLLEIDVPSTWVITDEALKDIAALRQ